VTGSGASSDISTEDASADFVDESGTRVVFLEVGPVVAVWFAEVDSDEGLDW
jgi:hypothetical protein